MATQPVPAEPTARIEKLIELLRRGDMQSFRLAARPLALAGGMLLCSTAPAYAYIDPGTGSMLLQALAGAVLVGGLLWRRLVAGIKNLLGRGEKTDAGNSDPH